MDKATQKHKILQYCAEHGSITNSPTKRISELRKAGYDVQTFDEERTKEDGTTVKFRRYFIGGVVS